MIIHFDTEIHWQRTAADLDDDQPRRYFAAPPPHLVVLVVYPEPADKLDGSLWLHGVKADCLVGDHAGDAPVGYTLPEFAGYQHSKITVRSLVDDDTPPDMTLTEFLAGAPTVEHLPDMKRSELRGGVTLFSAILPEILVDRLRDMAARRKVTVSELAWSVLQDYAESYP